MMAVEQHFQPADLALPDLLHHLFVFHHLSRFVMQYLETAKGYANSTPVPFRQQCPGPPIFCAMPLI